MTKPIARDPIYRRRRFEAEDHRDMRSLVHHLSAELSGPRRHDGRARIAVSHTTILRWVMRYVPEFEKRWAVRGPSALILAGRRDVQSRCGAGGTTSIAQSTSAGKTVDSLLRPDRGIAAAQAFFRKAVAPHRLRWPRKVNARRATPRVIRRCGCCAGDPKWKSVLVRSCRYLNNIVEQDHRAIKRRCASMLGFKSFGNAAITLAGIELAHRIRKRQFSFGRGRQRGDWSLKAALGSGAGAVSAFRSTAERISSARPPTHQNSRVKLTVRLSLLTTGRCDARERSSTGVDCICW